MSGRRTVRFAVDENFDHRILTGLRRRLPEVDAVRVQDCDLSGADDPRILQWAADEQRILLTHDIATMTRFALDRVRASMPMPGVFQVRTAASIGAVIEDLVLIAETSVPNEWEGQIYHLPF